VTNLKANFSNAANNAKKTKNICVNDHAPLPLLFEVGECVFKATRQLTIKLPSRKTTETLGKWNMVYLEISANPARWLRQVDRAG
jgi:hypothetical protein